MMLVISAIGYKNHAGHTDPVHTPTGRIARQPVAKAATAPVNVGLPVRIIIPKAQIDSAIGYVGVTKDGYMDMPKTITEAGWYKLGSLPGNTGTAVIAGHVNGYKGSPGVFRQLKTLVAGDAVQVLDNTGHTARFVVRDIKSYPQDAQPTEVFTSTTGTHLNLITCAGEWNESTQHYMERLVVFADIAP